MKKESIRLIVLVAALVALTCAGLAFSKASSSGTGNPVTGGPDPQPTVPVATSADGIHLSGHLTQDRIVAGGDGTVTLALTLGADPLSTAVASTPAPVDMIIVLDRSGSMSGAKIEDAKRASSLLLSRLGDQDRFAVVTYDNYVRMDIPLNHVTAATRSGMERAIGQIYPGGSTNLGAGLETGLHLLAGRSEAGRRGRVVLISDGLANRGVTDPSQLADMAGRASDGPLSVSTVGVGADFNELLMTAIADRGAGTYHFLENPSAFAEVFQAELNGVQVAAATRVEIRVPVANGVELVHAAGYPIERKGDMAVFRPGDLVAGRSRTLHLTFRVPAKAGETYDIHGVTARFHRGGSPRDLALENAFRVACVADEATALLSVKKDVWERKVLQSDYGQLRQKVADALRRGDRDEAMNGIKEYETRQQAMNEVVGSAAVAENLEKDVSQLKGMVDQSFAPSAAPEKRKLDAKSLQYEGYKQERARQ